MSVRVAMNGVPKKFRGLLDFPFRAQRRSDVDLRIACVRHAVYLPRGHRRSTAFEARFCCPISTATLPIHDVGDGPQRMQHLSSAFWFLIHANDDSRADILPAVSGRMDTTYDIFGAGTVGRVRYTKNAA